MYFVQLTTKTLEEAMNLHRVHSLWWNTIFSQNSNEAFRQNLQNHFDNFTQRY